MSCQNCLKIQTCENTRLCACESFELCGAIPEKPSKSKSLCIGCHNNFYNTERNGCWSYEEARVTLISYPYSLNQRPPFVQVWKLSCFRRKW
jgi:hypothetical protein